MQCLKAYIITNATNTSDIVILPYIYRFLELVCIQPSHNEIIWYGFGMLY